MLKTRLDSRSKENKSFKIIDYDGTVLAEISLLNAKGALLGVSTVEGVYIEKPDGWRSSKNGC